jgi:hypothetical protein
MAHRPRVKKNNLVHTKRAYGEPYALHSSYTAKKRECLPVLFSKFQPDNVDGTGL